MKKIGSLLKIEDHPKLSDINIDVINGMSSPEISKRYGLNKKTVEDYRTSGKLPLQMLNELDYGRKQDKIDNDEMTAFEYAKAAMEMSYKIMNESYKDEDFRLCIVATKELREGAKLILQMQFLVDSANGKHTEISDDVINLLEVIKVTKDTKGRSAIDRYRKAQETESAPTGLTSS